MKVLSLFSLLLLASCATKYIVPQTRFITPETQGDVFRGQVEFQQPKASLLTFDTSNGSTKDGVLASDIKRTGYLISTSLLDRMDLIWSHVGGANSMLGAKFQLLGGSRVQKAAGHKVSVAFLFGGNDYETDDRSVDFTLSAHEMMALYGYRFSEFLLLYSSLSIAKYQFDGTLNKSSDPALVGADLNSVSSTRGFQFGTEASFEQFFAKLELSYQFLSSSQTKKRTISGFGYSVGMSW